MKVIILYDKFDWLLYNSVLKDEGYVLEFKNAHQHVDGYSIGWVPVGLDLTEPMPEFKYSLIWRAVKYEP